MAYRTVGLSANLPWSLTSPGVIEIENGGRIAGVDNRVIAALDTSDIGQAREWVSGLREHVFAFKIGHALTLARGLGALEDLRTVGAERVFLDLKFHDIPSVVALAVREAADRGVWMLTMHASGGSQMMAAAAEAGRDGPILLGVTVLTSLDEAALRGELGVERTVEEQVTELASLAVRSGLHGVVCSVHEAAAVRRRLGDGPVLVTPGISLGAGASPDQRRTATAAEAFAAGASYVVIGRALTTSSDPAAALAELGV